MPYLHWESDRRRAQYAQVIREATDAHNYKNRTESMSHELQPTHTLSRSEQNGKAYPQTSQTLVQVASIAGKRRQTPPAPSKKTGTTTGFQKLRAFLLKSMQPAEMHASEATPIPAVPDKPIQLGRPQKLGVFLLKVAKIAEGVALHEHEQMIRDHLHETPPLHPRRTLDQAYYWTLKSTEDWWCRLFLE